MIANILGQGSQLREYASDVEEKLRQVELESIQVCQWSNVEYMAEANVEIGFSVTEIPVYCKVCLVKLSWDHTWWNLVCTFCHDLDKKSHTFEDVAMKYWKYASLQDYMKESDNLVSLHAKIRECDTILTHMESLLGGFQVRWRCNQ